MTARDRSSLGQDHFRLHKDHQDIMASWDEDKMASWDKKLLKATEEGNIKEVEICIKNGASLECRTDDSGGLTPLMLAALIGHLEVVTFLVSHGSQLEVTDKFGLTALHYAAQSGEIDVTKWLIDQGCSPWVKSKQGKTPYDLLKIESYDNEERKRKKKELMDFLEVVGLDVELVVGPEIVGLEVEFVVCPEVVGLEVEFVVAPVGLEVKFVGPGDTVVGPSIDDCGVAGGIAIDKHWQV
ncbi:poly [ADP-ribose] polymerase tankyrase-like [Mytilus edulis]|uniref:poly [ADP-ribose] polymerase tankyrase-like n=1 Tax=Mytilus edulis TaxID=6550 RepID=UPI0039EF805A